MNIVNQIIKNPIFVCAALGWFVAQVLKTIIHCIVNKEFVLERLIGNGGMPSSHSATVCALATATGMTCGFDGFPFAMSTFFAIIVMNDAMGVRLETGKQAIVLNDMMELFKEMGRWDGKHPIEHLKEFVGHTPLQILIGAILGICIAVTYCNLAL
ncbi:MAG: divergent PAP2 family protein [Lachnospiraceae bacterium]|nr:divergent PAP2 family protein [Lachnospiraceae bacterium]